MPKQLRILSINFPFSSDLAEKADSIATKKALFDFEVVIIRPEKFNFQGDIIRKYEWLESWMSKKREELAALLQQGGLLVVILDVVSGFSSAMPATNYDFLYPYFSGVVAEGDGQQVTYLGNDEPFVEVLKQSRIRWTAYLRGQPVHPFNDLQFFARVGQAGIVGAKMPYFEGNIVFLPNIIVLDESAFISACEDYCFKRRGTQPPDWVSKTNLPGTKEIEKQIELSDAEITKAQNRKNALEIELEDRSIYKKLLYEKGRIHLEPAAIRALDDIGLNPSPSEIIKGTNFEIDGRTTVGARPGIVEVKGSKNQISLDEFSVFPTKLMADHKATDVISKGILIGNGRCEDVPSSRLGNVVFTKHVLDSAKMHSVVLLNSVEIYWLCTTLMEDKNSIDKAVIREAILNTNGYLDLKSYCGKSPF